MSQFAEEGLWRGPERFWQDRSRDFAAFEDRRNASASWTKASLHLLHTQ